MDESTPQAESKLNLLFETYFGTAENTFDKSPLLQDFDPFNPDDLWQKTGDYSIYEDMLKDDQVSICMKLKKDLVIGSGFHFVKTDEEQDEIEDFLEDTFNNDVETLFVDSIEEIISAYEFGFSVTEKIFKQRYDNFLTLKYLKTRHPQTWLFYKDDKGNIEKLIQRSCKGDIEIDQKSVIKYINSPRFGNCYGESDLRAAYNAWFAKRQVIRYYAIFLEKAASPTPVGRYDKSAPKKAIADLFSILKNFQTKTAITIPKDIEVEFLESSNTGEAYSKAINIFNMFIGRALFIPDLLGVSGSETGGGSLALGKEQISIFMLHILRRRNKLETLINNEIIKPIVLFNFGNVEYPKFQFKSLEDDKTFELAKAWLDAVKGNVFKPNEDEINHFRKLVKFPEGEVVFKEPAPSPFQSQSPDPKIEAPMNEAEDLEEQDDEAEEELEDKQLQTSEVQLKFAYPQAEGNYHKKVNFKQLKNKLNDYDDSLVNEGKSLIKKIYADFFDQLQKKKVITRQDIDVIDEIKLKGLKDLKQLLKQSQMDLYKDAQSQAMTELDKSNFAQPTTSQEFLDLIESENYNFIGDWQYNLKKKARIEVVAAIKDGRPISTVIDILDMDGKKLSEVQLERYARTKHTEVMNRGRVKAFEESGVVDAYQYSAIMDGSTTPICSALHNKIFAKGTEPIPPCHFNCRSTLIPITKYEKFKPTTSIKGQDPQDFINENIGDGFSTK
jgi:SPP1 gp7 family putative phage head morphogenesis protein